MVLGLLMSVTACSTATMESNQAVSPASRADESDDSDDIKEDNAEVDQDKVDLDDEEEITAVPPTVISGAYLACVPSTVDSDENLVSFACSIKDENENLGINAIKELSIFVADDTDTVVYEEHITDISDQIFYPRIPVDLATATGHWIGVSAINGLAVPEQMGQLHSPIDQASVEQLIADAQPVENPEEIDEPSAIVFYEWIKFPAKANLPRNISFSELLSLVTERSAELDRRKVEFELAELISGSLSQQGSNSIVPGSRLKLGEQWAWQADLDVSGNNVEGFVLLAWDLEFTTTSKIVVLFDIAAPENRIPSFSSIEKFTGNEGEAIQITYEDLLSSSDAMDADGDSIEFEIVAIEQGELTVDTNPNVDIIAQAGTRLISGSSWTWQAPLNLSGSDILAFTILAWDGKANSLTPIPVYFDLMPMELAPSSPEGILPAGVSIDVETTMSVGFPGTTVSGYNETYNSARIGYFPQPVEPQGIAPALPDDEFFSIDLENAEFSKGALLEINGVYYNWENLPDSNKLYTTDINLVTPGPDGVELLESLSVVYDISVYTPDSVEYCVPTPTGVGAQDPDCLSFDVKISSNGAIIWTGSSYNTTEFL